MRRVFLSYRRDDSQTVTSFIYQHLEDPAAFGPGSVFMDIDDIPDGVDFRDVIDEVVQKCEFFLHVIGPRWVTPRLMDSNDWVRLEIEAALRRKIPVTPVLVDGATMPGEDVLPPSLHPLRFKNARTIRHGKHFREDVLDMVKGLHRGQKWLADRAAASQIPTGERRDVSPPVVPAAPLQPEGLSPPAQASGLGKVAEVAPSLKGSFTGSGETLSGSEDKPPENPGRSPGLKETALRAEDKPPVKLIVPAEPKLVLPPAVVPVRKAGDQTTITLPGGVPMTFAWCPPGTFMMGSPPSETGREQNEGRHPVRLSKGFWMSIHPVTQDQYQSISGSNPSCFKGGCLPVDSVTWKDTEQFCENLKQKCEIQLRLPTEAEWEYSSRGGTNTPFYWGEKLNGNQANCDGSQPYVEWLKGPYRQRTTPVGLYAREYPHPWGLTDVIGNVSEWCSDWYGAYPIVKEPPSFINIWKLSSSFLFTGPTGIYGTFFTHDPQGPQEGTNKILRGGSWLRYARHCRVAFRGSLNPSESGRTDFGFRLAADAASLG